jgi:hypothetical protein
MFPNMSDAVTCKFDELIHSLNHYADDIKIACAEASLEGDFKQVTKLSDTSLKLQRFIEETNNLLDRWHKNLETTSSHENKQISYKKTNLTKNSPTILSVMLSGKKIQEKTASDTFITAIENMGIERVASLGKKLSGIPLLSNVKSTGYHTQRKCGSWYVTTHSSTKNMKILLEEIGRSLKIPIQVEIVEKN